MESSIEVQNLGELQRDLTALAAKLTKRELVSILRPGAKVMQKAIKQRTPVRKGLLKRAVKVKVGLMRISSSSSSVTVSYTATRFPSIMP